MAWTPATVKLFAVAATLILLLAITYRSHSSLTLSYLDQVRPETSYEREDIPNILHIVFVKKDEYSHLYFGFASFLSIYSALHYTKSDRIYLHTDFSDDTIANLRSSSLGKPEDKWTQAVLDLPQLHINHVTTINRTDAGVEIKLVQHKSDFVRTNVVRDWGGMYFDTDVFLLRDTKPLREAGFRNVFGRENPGGLVNNGIFLARPNTATLEILDRAAHLNFDGGWNKHSSQTWSQVCERLHDYPNEVLILDDGAFCPTSWEEPSVRGLFEPFLDEDEFPPATARLKAENMDPSQWWQLSRESKKEGELDFSRAYVIHSFERRFEGHTSNIPGYTGVTPAYVFARQSNFARAVYPAARDAYNRGFFTDDDLELL
ncbi:hypothetical protein LTR96_011166 [Exophiala xenobiotica]|nr:hypothetical protein LTR72_011537 [Exophiala xenobiotica]KAK5263428.1 hypothetical protein LTR96_011166 [Exophiala xenobiotica]KAK5285127.1 hypothetical protein LTR14_011215 [Exophiala xenobiotica]KAK5332556.1 hypothetical protein LTR98_011317 [Exophiala xenobiotica]KAK5468962.1 hypothetical protein LTR55_011505 [Exophiala xenobiotica]